jgi:hypothetical protein
VTIQDSGWDSKVCIFIRTLSLQAKTFMVEKEFQPRLLAFEVTTVSVQNQNSTIEVTTVSAQNQNSTIICTLME